MESTKTTRTEPKAQSAGKPYGAISDHAHAGSSQEARWKPRPEFSRTPPWPATLAVIAAALALFSYSSAPDLTLVDSGELALAAAGGGVAHPPGFPLYLILGRVFIQFAAAFGALCDFASAGAGAVTPVRALNLMSAFFGALTVGLIFAVCDRSVALLAPRDGCGNGESRERKLRLLAALFAALMLASSRKMWFWSGLTEVYTLGTALMSAAWLCSLLWIERRQVAGDDHRWLLAATALASLGLANHHATAVLIAPGLAFTVLLLRPGLLLETGFLAKLALASLCGPALYAWLPIVARGDNGLGWGGIDSVSTLLRHIAGWQYRAQVSSDASMSLSVAIEFVRSLVLDCGIPATLMAVTLPFSQIPVLRRVLLQQENSAAKPDGVSPGLSSRVGAAVLAQPLALLVSNLALVMIYFVGAEDRSSYELPAALSLCVLAGCGAAGAARLLLDGISASGRPGRNGAPAPPKDGSDSTGSPVSPARSRGSLSAAASPAAGRNPAGLALALLLLASTAGNLLRNFDYCNMREERSARLLVQESLDPLPRGSLVFSSEWNFYAPYLYMRHIENYRPDISVVDLLLLRRFWYADYLDKHLPSLIEPVRAEFETFREQVNRFDRGLEYNDAEIAAAYDALLKAMVLSKLAVPTGGEAGAHPSAASPPQAATAFIDFTSLKRPQERAWVRSFSAQPDGMLVRLDGRGSKAATARKAMEPKNRDNLYYLERRFGGVDALRDPRSIDPTSLRYWKVYSAYLDPVEASLLGAALNGDKAKVAELTAGYNRWFPGTAFVLESVKHRINSWPSQRAPAGRP